MRRRMTLSRNNDATYRPIGKTKNVRARSKRHGQKSKKAKRAWSGRMEGAGRIPIGPISPLFYSPLVPFAFSLLIRLHQRNATYSKWSNRPLHPEARTAHCGQVPRSGGSFFLFFIFHLFFCFRDTSRILMTRARDPSSHQIHANVYISRPDRDRGAKSNRSAHLFRLNLQITYCGAQSKILICCEFSHNRPRIRHLAWSYLA